MFRPKTSVELLVQREVDSFTPAPTHLSNTQRASYSPMPVTPSVNQCRILVSSFVSFVLFRFKSLISNCRIFQIVDDKSVMKLDLARVFGGVEAGVKVDIKRSDGRIHEACVTGINVEQQTVSVEWLEHNETKGDIFIVPLQYLEIAFVFQERELTSTPFTI